MFVESHRHLSGSILPATVWKIIQKFKLFNISTSIDDVYEQLCILPENADFQDFCSKLDILKKLPWSDWVLELVANQVCADLKATNIRHSTLSLSLNKFAENGDLIAAGERVFDIIDKAAANAGVTVNYLISISYSWPLELQIETLKLIESLGHRVAGIDFVNDETVAQWAVYTKFIKPWRERNKAVRAHVGERFGTSENIKTAIDMGVSRIAHGIYATPEQQDKSIERGIVFDMSLHSNIYTNAIPKEQHPIKDMQSRGCLITLGTDDPTQFRCTMQDEYNMAETLGADSIALRQVADALKII
jgi:adenosine deaminase